MADLTVADPVGELRATVEASVAALRGEGAEAGATPGLERPPKPEFGDYSTNAAMLLAPSLGGKPRDVAEQLAAELAERLGDRLERTDVAGPGFLNIFLSDAWYRDAATALAETGDMLGRPAPPSSPARILIEFVSANPTGPLTAAGGRHAAYGDAVARLLEFAGQRVEREYYVNDMGGQIERFAASIAARMTAGDLPEDGYEGEYVTELAQRLTDEGTDPADLKTLATRGPELMTEAIRATLERYGVSFDTWYSERSLHEGGRLKAALEDLEKRGHAYKSEGATWLRTTTFGDDKDRVLLRSGGEPTYYLADVAYHRDKAERGFDPFINVLGADHHGYVGRLHAGLEALGLDRDRLQVEIMQLVHVVERGERSQMSKRKGEFVTLDELLGDIGADATRFFMLQRSHDTTVDLDLELARRTSSENPVYYVQYAHARIASILRKAEAEGMGREGPGSAVSARAPERVEPAERELLKRLFELSSETADAAERRAPHRIAAYAGALAADFHSFYRDCQVVGAPGEGVEAFRLELCGTTKTAIATSLDLLGISAPEQM